MPRQAVITGLGIVSPIGVGVEAFWRAALAGRSGIGRPTLFDASNLPPECGIVGEVRDFDPRDWMPSPAWKMAGRFSQFAVAAAKMALDDSRLDVSRLNRERFMVSFGTSISGMMDVQLPNFVAFLRGEPMAPWTALEHSPHAATSRVAMTLGAGGQANSISTACAAGLDAITWAASQVCRGEAQAVIAGGTDTPLLPGIIEAFRALGALSRWDGPPSQASRPFEKLRTGLVIAEGAAAVVVEDASLARDRGATIYATVDGWASRTEATHMREIDRTGRATAHVIESSLRSCGRLATEVDYICAHGNSLVDYDAAETAGIKKVLGRHAWNCPVSSIKSMCGQALAAASAMQFVAACLALRDGTIPPTINYDVADAECDLDYVPNVARVARLRTALVHAQSIGGSHTAVVLGAPER